jgi:hypothetical protein
MSWKSLVCAGLLCVVASPALAQNPTLSVTLLRDVGGLPVLDATGDWQWVVSVTPESDFFANSGAMGTPPNTVGGSVATELGFTATGRNLLNIAANATNFPANNPGTAIPGGFPAGPGAVRSGNQAVVFLGSTFLTAESLQQAAIITTDGPIEAAGDVPGSVLTWSGAYAGNGRIAQNGTNYDMFAGAKTADPKSGDTNLNGTVNSTDLGILLNNINQAGKFWQHGDFNGNGIPNSTDVGILLNNINQMQQVEIPFPGGGSGGLAASGVPEPTSIVLLLIGSLLAVARRARG